MMLRQYGLIGVMVLALTGFTTTPIRPSVAAETIDLTLGETSLVEVPVGEFETYLQTGTAGETLEPIVSLVSEQQATDLRNFLGKNISVKPAPFSQFLQSKLGLVVLENLSNIFKPTGTDTAPIKALQTAMTTASSSGSFTLIDVIKSFPTSGMIIDLETVNGATNDMKSFGSDVQLLLASFGVDVTVSSANFDPDAIAGWIASVSNYASEINSFVKTTGITEAELKAEAPPTGTVTLQKADIHRLYQKLNLLVKQAGQSTGIEVK